MAQGAAGLPFQQQVAPVAGFSQDQLSAFQQMRDSQGMAQPYFNQASNLFNQSAQPINAAQVGNYLNPYANYVMAGLEDVFGQQRRDTTGRLTQAAGGVGADRIGVGQANLAKQQGLAAGQTLAGIYQPALNAAQQDAQRQQSAAFGFGQLGPAAQNAAMIGTQGLYNFGGLQQQQQQAQLNAPYQWDLARIAHQYQVPQWLSQLTAQMAPSLGGTTNTTNTYPGQSPWGTIAGLGLTAAGAMTGNPLMMGSGLKGAIGGMAPQTGGMTSGGWSNTGGGWNPNVPGGYVYPSMAAGGVVDPDDAFRSFQGGGDVLDLEQQPDGTYGTSLEPAGNFNSRFNDVYLPPTNVPGYVPSIQGSPEQNAPPPMAMPQTQPALPPVITGSQDGMPPSAMGFAAAPHGSPPALPPPAVQPAQANPYELPPDSNEGSWSRGPGAALMAAGLGTLAASGRRDARGLPMSPWAAIGEGGLRGIETLKTQDTAATQRRRVDLEAKRLLMVAEKSRRDAELHPFALKSAEQQTRQADIALRALAAGENILSNPDKLKELGITPAQAAILGPSGVRAVVQDLAKSKYDIKEVNGETWAIDRLNPSRSIRIGAGRGLSAYGIPDETGTPTAPVGGVLGTQLPRQPVAGVGQSPTKTNPTQPAGRSTTPQVAGSATEAFGPVSVFNWVNLKAQGVSQNRASINVTEQARAQARINILRDRLISALASGQPGERLKMVQERVQGLFPKPGQFFTPAPEAKASFIEFHAELGDRIKENETIINSPGYQKATKDKAAQAILEQRRVRDQLTNILENMSESEQPSRRTQQRMTRPKTFEKNRVYDTPKGRLKYLGNDRWGPP